MASMILPRTSRAPWAEAAAASLMAWRRVLPCSPTEEKRALASTGFAFEAAPCGAGAASCEGSIVTAAEMAAISTRSAFCALLERRVRAFLASAIGDVLVKVGRDY